MTDRPDRARNHELLVTLFMALRAHLGVRDALAATRWVQAAVARDGAIWS